MLPDLRAKSGGSVRGSSGARLPIGSLVSSRLSVPGDTLIPQVEALFANHPDEDAIAVLESDGVGLVNRARFFLTLGHRFGFALYERRPVRLLAEKGLVVSASLESPEVVSLALRREPTRILDDVIVTRSDSFEGLVSMRSLMAHHKELLALAFTEVGLLEQRAQNLERAYDELSRLHRAKSEFITVASHELGTPLTLIMGYTDLLAERAAGGAAELTPFLDGIRDGTKRLHAIFEDLAALARFEQGKPELGWSEVDLAALVARVVAQFSTSLAERSQRLSVVGTHDLPKPRGDAEALGKVVHHIVMNAIKYTPDGGSITVRGRTVSAGTDAVVELEVVDTGIGVDPADQDRIFESFAQTGEVRHHSSGRTKFKGGGPGLGLAVARKIMEAHGGWIWVESRGRDEAACPGSRFVMSLPLRGGV
jgi:signal transduction histidine kinase